MPRHNLISFASSKPTPSSGKFDIRDHIGKLEVVKDLTSEYHCKCPVCGAGGLKIDKETGKWNNFACDCDKKEIRNAIAPWESWQKPARPKQKRQWQYTDWNGHDKLTVERTDDFR